MKSNNALPVGPAAVTELLPPACSASDPAAILLRIDWLFRGMAPTRPMQQLREIVQRYRLEARS